MIKRIASSLRKLRRTAGNAMIDLRFGGFVGGYQPNPIPGANGTGATDYALMPQIFDGRIKPDDVLVDVGCGYGRVINWWLYRGHQNKIFGLEILPEVAQHLRRRLRKYSQVTILTGDAIANLPPEGTLFFLFNPFGLAEILERFLDRAWEIYRVQPGLRILYFAPVLLDVARSDPRWQTELIPLALPAVGFFEERHRHLAIITPRSAVSPSLT